MTGTTWRHVLLGVAVDLEDEFDALKAKLLGRLGQHQPLQIVAYRTYGTENKLCVKGRVLRDKGVRSARLEDNLWDNLLNMYRRFQSDEIPYARVVARYRGLAQEMTADEEGYFEGWLVPPPGPAAQEAPDGPEAPDSVEDASEGLWREVELELVSPAAPNGQVQATAHVLVPPPSARFGVISDIDDTVVRTDVAHLLRMARTVFLGNARLRLPFEGVAAFYRALYAGAGGHDRNPLFYVSNSPWNMYDLFSDFFQLQDIPVGPVLILRDWGLSTSEGLAPLGARHFKAEAIHRVLDQYPNLPFILLGDSGEHDPEIYAEVVARAPGRILAVYIRNVTPNPRRAGDIQKLAEQVVAAGSVLILADNTEPLARHAAAQGWIAPEALPHIVEAKAADQAPPTPVEKLLGEEAQPRQHTPTVVVKDHVPSKEAIQDAMGAGGPQTAASGDAE